MKPDDTADHVAMWLRRARNLVRTTSGEPVEDDARLLALTSRAEELTLEIAREQLRNEKLRTPPEREHSSTRESLHKRSARRLEQLEKALDEVRAGIRELTSRPR